MELYIDLLITRIFLQKLRAKQINASLFAKLVLNVFDKAPNALVSDYVNLKCWTMPKSTSKLTDALHIRFIENVLTIYCPPFLEYHALLTLSAVDVNTLRFPSTIAKKRTVLPSNGFLNVLLIKQF